MVLDKISGDLLEWPECSAQFVATIEQFGVAHSVKMNYLKTLVTGKAQAATEGMGYSVQLYHVAWQTLACDFGRCELVVNAKQRKIHAYPFNRAHDSLETVQYSQMVSGRVLVITQFGYEMVIGSDSVLSIAVRKLPL